MTHACDHARQPHRPAAETRRALALAQSRCVEAGQRWTRPRQRVLELLLKASGPVKAYDLIADFDEDHAAKPPTVYRALEFLETLGLAHRIPSLNAYVACEADEPLHAASFLICDCCGSAEEFDPKVGPAARAEAERLGFRPKSMAVEVHGLCRSCAG